MPATLVYSLSDIVEIDATGSNGVLSLVQTEGTTASITEPSTGIFRIARPRHADILIFNLIASADGPDVSQEIRVYPIKLSQQLVFLGGTVGDLDNWV